MLFHPAHIPSTELPCFTYEAERWRLWMIACTSQMYALSNFLYSFHSLVCWADFLTDCLIDGYSKGTFTSPINNPLKVFLFFFPPKVPLNQFSERWSLPHLSLAGCVSGAGCAPSIPVLGRGPGVPEPPLAFSGTGLARHRFVLCSQKPNRPFFNQWLLAHNLGTLCWRGDEDKFPTLKLVINYNWSENWIVNSR